MIKFILPNNYKEKILDKILEEENISYCIGIYTREIKKYLSNNNNVINPNTVIVSTEYINWCLELPKQEKLKYFDVSPSQWYLLLLNKGPKEEQTLKNNEIIWFNKENEYTNYKNNNNIPKASIEKIINLEI